MSRIKTAAPAAAQAPRLHAVAARRRRGACGVKGALVLLELADEVRIVPGAARGACDLLSHGVDRAVEMHGIG